MKYVMIEADETAADAILQAEAIAADKNALQHAVDAAAFEWCADLSEFADDKVKTAELRTRAAEQALASAEHTARVDSCVCLMTAPDGPRRARERERRVFLEAHLRRIEEVHQAQEALASIAERRGQTETCEAHTLQMLSCEASHQAAAKFLAELPPAEKSEPA